MKSLFKNFITYILVICLLTIYIIPCVNVSATTTYNFSYSAMQPYNGSTVENNLQNITISFGRAIAVNNQALYDSIVVMNSKNNTVISSTLSFTNTNTALQITLTGTLDSNTTYTIYIPGGAFKYSTETNYINSPISTYFITSNNAFSPSSTTPYNNQSSVSLNLQHVTLNFYYDIEINNQQQFDAIKVRDTAGRIVSSDVVITRNLLQIKINAILEQYTMYTVYIPKGTLKCRPDNSTVYSISDDINLKFTTINDTTGPNYLPNQQYGNNEGIDPKASLEIKFDKKIKLTKDIYKIKLTQVNNDIEVPVNADISQDEYTLIITPKQTLAVKQNYTLLVPRTAISDLFMNIMYNDFTMSFKTSMDLAPPEIILSSISNNATDVPIGTNEIIITFSKPIRYAEQYQLVELKDSTGTAASIRKSISSDKLIITLPSPLVSNTAYTLTIPQKAVQDIIGNSFGSDYYLNFTTNIVNGATMDIASSALIDGLEADAGTPYEDILKYFLPTSVSVTTSDKTNPTALLDVNWYQCIPEYKSNVAGTYVFKGKLVVKNNILNTRNVFATAKLTVVDKQLPVWKDDAYLDSSNTTNTTTKIEWQEATDDTLIKEYSVELKVDGVSKKTVKISPTQFTRLSDDKNNYRYNILNFVITGLTADTRYTAFITAYDSKGKATDRALETSFRTDSPPVRPSNNTPTPRPTVRPSTRPTSTPSTNGAESKYFDDLKNYAWAVDSIDALVKRGVIKGTSETSFSPSDNITRADLTLLIMRAFDFGASSSDNFADVSENAYYYDKVGIAKKLGIIKGDMSNLFYPEEYISREDMFVILKRAIDNSSVTLDNLNVQPSSFTDIDSVSDYAKNAVEALIKANIITGDNKKVKPKESATRAEVAVLIGKLNI